MLAPHVQIEVGEWVWLPLFSSCCNVRQMPRFYEPFKVLERIGNMAYWLKLPPKAHIHGIFHVVFLKFTGATPEQIIPLPVIVHGRMVSSPEAILCACPSATSWDLLVQWSGQPPETAAWEPLEQFK